MQGGGQGCDGVDRPQEEHRPLQAASQQLWGGGRLHGLLRLLPSVQRDSPALIRLWGPMYPAWRASWLSGPPTHSIFWIK